MTAIKKNNQREHTYNVSTSCFFVLFLLVWSPRVVLVSGVFGTDADSLVCVWSVANETGYISSRRSLEGFHCTWTVGRLSILAAEVDMDR